MSTPGSLVAGTIEDILVSLARGVRDAQDQLNKLEPFDEYGRPKPQYFLPYLDFTLKINAVETKTTDGGAAAQAAPSIGAFSEATPSIGTFSEDTLWSGAAGQSFGFTSVRAPPITFALANPAKTSSTTSNEIYSTVSGRFVAVPPNDAMPQITLNIASIANASAAGKRTVTVAASYGAGGPVRAATIEFNADPVATAALNQLSTPVPLDNTRLFQSGSVTTNESGVAATGLDLTAFPAGIVKVLVVANLGPVRVSIVVSNAS
jgi:hypothetical protein